MTNRFLQERKGRSERSLFRSQSALSSTSISPLGGSRALLELDGSLSMGPATKSHSITSSRIAGRQVPITREKGVESFSQMGSHTTSTHLHRHHSARRIDFRDERSSLSGEDQTRLSNLNRAELGEDVAG